MSDEDETAAETTLRSSETKKGYVRQLGDLGDKITPVTYTVAGDDAVLEGCIVLGKVADMDEFVKDVDKVGGPEAASQLAGLGSFVKFARFLWPLGRVPFTIDPGLPNQDRVKQAIKHWTDEVGMEFVPRTNHPDFVTFRRGDLSSSRCGRVEGQQFINLRDDATFGNVVHEIGHALGLWHEQSRIDRDKFIKIHLENVDPNQAHNFDQHIDDGVDVGDYNYDSIMHYGPKAFSVNGKATIVTKGGQAIGQRKRLSPGDIAVVKAAYKKEFAKRIA